MPPASHNAHRSLMRRRGVAGGMAFFMVAIKNTSQMKHSLILSLMFVPLVSAAQSAAQSGAVRQTTVAATATEATPPDATATFGYFSYNDALQSMPEYATAQRQLAELRAKYEAEAKRAEADFNGKYEDFLEGQRDFPASILQKRQSELAELMAKNTAFREESQRLLADAERDAYAPLHAKLAAMLKVVGEKEGFAFILNTDGNACPYINPAMGKDINQLVKDCLK